MRRVFRILPHIMSALSFLLLLATVAGWVRGTWAREYFGAIREVTTDADWVSREWGVTWGGGDVGGCFAWGRAGAAPAKAAGCPAGVRWGNRFNSEAPARASRRYATWAGGWVRAGHRAGAWDGAGISAGWAQGLDWHGSVTGANVPGADRRYYWLALPCWMAAAVFAVLPGRRAWVMARRRRGRRARLLAARICPSCGYDVRASPEQCPECGTLVSTIAPEHGGRSDGWEAGPAQSGGNSP